MVIYDLVCQSGHEFEGWFRNAEELVSQQESKILTCPFCNTVATNVGSSLSNETDGVDMSAERFGKLQTMLGKVHDYVDKNFEDVGNRFAEEALSIHNGEKESANIRGTATQSEIKELEKEGVAALPLPAKPVAKKDLN